MSGLRVGVRFGYLLNLLVREVAGGQLEEFLNGCRVGNGIPTGVFSQAFDK
jgi:hypothetical protein